MQKGRNTWQRLRTFFYAPDSIQIKGHRIGLEQIVRAHRDGATAEDIARDYPGLPLELIYAALTYYLRNQLAVDAYVAEREQESEAAYTAWAKNPPAVVKRLQARRSEQSANIATAEIVI